MCDGSCKSDRIEHGSATDDNHVTASIEVGRIDRLQKRLDFIKSVLGCLTPINPDRFTNQFNVCVRSELMGQPLCVGLKCLLRYQHDSC